MENEESSFTVADFRRMVTVLNTKIHISQQVYLTFVFAGFTGQVNMASINRLFKVSGVKDLLFKQPFSSVLLRVLGKEGNLSKAEIAEAVKRGMDDQDFQKAVAVLFR